MKGFRPDQSEAAGQFIRNCDYGDDLYIKTSTFNREKILARMEAGETVVGIAMDVDAGKKDCYALQDDVWGAMHRMRHPPSMAVTSGRADHGFHYYWKFDKPVAIKSVTDVERLNHLAKALRNKMRDKVAEVLTERGVTDFDKEKLVDRTYAVDRVLRPVGAVRKCGTVKILTFNPKRAYTEEQLAGAEWELPVPTERSSEPSDPTSPIARYFRQMKAVGKEITIGSILIQHGYSPVGEGNWLRSDAETGSRSLAEGDVINGLPGVNVFSGG